MLTDDWTDKLAAMKPYEWRVGRKVPINVYEGERPICQCHTAMDAARIVASMRWESEIIRLRSELLDARKEIERSTTAQVAAVQMVLEGADGSLINGRIGEPLRAIAAKLAAVPEKIEHRELRYALWQIAVALDLDPASTAHATLVNAVKRAVEAKPESTEPKQ